MIRSLQIGLSAIRANQIGMDTVAHNLANANTPGYHRQEAIFTERPPIKLYGLELGQGVDVTRIRRVQNSALDQAYSANLTEVAGSEALLGVANQLESLLTPGAGSLQGRITNFYDRLEQLSSRPHDTAARSAVIRAADEVTASLRTVGESAARIQTDLETQIGEALQEVDSISAELFQINRQIVAAEARGETPGNLLDRRGSLLNQLSEYVDVESHPHNGTVSLAGGAVTIGTTPVQLLEMRVDAEGVHLVQAGSDTPVQLTRGKLGGLLTARNDLIGQFEDKLDSIANALVVTFDQQHAQGVGLDGGFHKLVSQRVVDDVNAPLADAELGFPVSNGMLSISVIDSNAGTRVLHQVNIDPNSTSLAGLAAAIHGIPNLIATADANSGQLTIAAAPGFQFDFSGLPTNVPDQSGLSGTSSVNVYGSYQGSNTTLNLQFDGSGTIGVDQPLRLNVRDGSGTILDTLDIGLGYEPGSPLEISPGLFVELTSGTVQDGESFEVEAVSNGDTSGVLSALGINSFFVGTGYRNLQVKPPLLASPDLLATSQSGAPNDSANLTKLIATRDKKILSDGRQTIDDFMAQLVSDVGLQVESLQRAVDHGELVGQSLESQQLAVSGVDPNEELIRMMQYQNSFQAASRLLGVANEMLAELMNIIR